MSSQSRVPRVAQIVFHLKSRGCNLLPMRSARQVAKTSMIIQCSKRDTIGL
jgi:hypothetical protein